jgi:hypothetical protein
MRVLMVIPQAITVTRHIMASVITIGRIAIIHTQLIRTMVLAMGLHDGAAVGADFMAVAGVAGIGAATAAGVEGE